ncbi:hypothetical protein Tco_0063281 [Tanacetum coccineum]
MTARVESSDSEESLGEDTSKQGRIDAIDADEEITLVSVHDVNVSTGEEVFAITVDDITLAQVLEEMKSTKPKKKGIAKIDVDHQLAERMQAQEQEELSIEEKATLFQQLLRSVLKFFLKEWKGMKRKSQNFGVLKFFLRWKGRDGKG